MSKLGDMTLAELLVDGKDTPADAIIMGLPGDDKAKAEIIENNLTHEIVQKMSGNKVYYGELSKMLESLILRRKTEALSYEEYLRQIEEIARAALHPEEDDTYPAPVKDSAARRALFDHLSGNADLALMLDNAIQASIRPGWHDNRQKQQHIKGAVYRELCAASYTEAQAHEQTERIFDIVQRQAEYDQ